MRNIKSILKILSVSDTVFAEYEATQLAVEAEQKRQRVHKQADYALDRIRNIQKEVDQVNETLDDLDMHSANLSIPILEDTTLRLMGFMEETK